jgi:hypothetical protein
LGIGIHQRISHHHPETVALGGGQRTGNESYSSRLNGRLLPAALAQV